MVPRNKQGLKLDVKMNDKITGSEFLYMTSHA